MQLKISRFLRRSKDLSLNNEKVVGENEVLGRRLFDKGKTKIIRKTKDEVQFNDFWEKRNSQEISLDMLGSPNPIKGRKRKLTGLSITQAATRTPALKFVGWASMKRKQFKVNKVTCDVVSNPMEDNPWHAHLINKIDNENANYLFAMAIHHEFTRHGIFVEPSNP